MLRETEKARKELAELDAKLAARRQQNAALMAKLKPEEKEKAEVLIAALMKARQLSLALARAKAIKENLQAELSLKRQHNEVLENQLVAEKKETAKLHAVFAAAKARQDQAKQGPAEAGKAGLEKKVQLNSNQGL